MSHQVSRIGVRDADDVASGVAHAQDSTAVAADHERIHELATVALPATLPEITVAANVSAVIEIPSALRSTSDVRHYTELDGAEGRGVLFRPHRFTVDELAPVQGTVSVRAGRDVLACPVRDVSQNGVAFSWGAAPPPRKGQRLAIMLRFDAHEAFRGEVRVGSVREQEGCTVVGVSFDDFLIDVEEILNLRDVRGWTPKHIGARQHRKWRIAGGERFRSLVSELRLYFEDAEQELADLERRLPWHVLQGPENPVRSALVSRLRAEFVGDVVRLTEEIDDALRDVPDAHAAEAAKQWSLRHVHEYLMQAPCCHRARHKPFGYAGDYEVMNFIYERNFEGPTLFARAVALAFTNTRAAQAVRYRKDLVKRQINALLQQRAGADRPVRVLSIASGPAQEMFELLSECDELPAPLDVVLFEQDKNALTHAWRRLKPVVDARFPGAVRLVFLNDSVKRLLRDASLFAPYDKFDLIYSCGLYDYLAPRTCVTLTNHLSGANRPGGQLIVANMTDHPTRWLLDHHLDWPLIYRAREDLLDIARRAVPGAQLRVLEEESGVNPFVEITRP